ncbi:hypothetical protein CUPS3778_02560, partial [Campylobacter upsaliensis]
KLDDEIKGAEIILEHNKSNLLQKVKVQIVEADIIFAKIYGRMIEEL